MYKYPHTVYHHSDMAFIIDEIKKINERLDKLEKEVGNSNSVTTRLSLLDSKVNALDKTVEGVAYIALGGKE